MAPMPDDRPEPSDRGWPDPFEEPYAGDAAAARDAARHHGYEAQEDGGRIYTDRRSSAPVPRDMRCPSCGFTRPVCASLTCIRAPWYLAEAA